MSRNGFRQTAQPSKKKQVRELEVTLKNLSAAIRIMQMMQQQLATNYQTLQNDLGKLMGVVNNLQYKSQALNTLLKVDDTALNAEADVIKLKDYAEASDKEDLEKNLTVIDAVEANSICIITSSCATDETKAIFRSKFRLDECGVPELQEKLLGCTAGNKISVTLNKDLHVIELLGVRRPPPVEAKAEDTVEAAAVEVAQEAAAATAH